MNLTIRKVIIVDDESLIREILPLMIDWETMGFEIVGLFEDGEEAWQFIQDNKDIELVISDIQMDVCTGLELLNRIRNDGLRIRVIMISGYDEFQYLRDAMLMGIDNYLLKPINKEELIGSLQQIQENLMVEYLKSREMNEGMELMKNNILNQIIMDHYSIRDVREKCNLLGINLEAGSFQIAVVDTIIRQTKVPLLQERHLSQFAIKNITDEILSHGEKVDVFVNQNGQIIVLFSGINDHSQASIRLRMEEVCSLIYHALKIYVIALVGKPCSSWREIGQSYSSAMELYDYRYFVEASTVVDYTQTDDGAKKASLSKQLGLILLNERLENEEYERAEESLHQIGKLLEEIGVPDLNLVRSVFIDFTLVCLSKLRRLEFEILEHNLRFPKSIDALFETGSTQQLFNNFKEIAVYLLQTLQQLKVNRNTNIIEKVIRYIDSNYMDNVSIQYLSQKYHISAPYLGKQLRLELGITFNDYLNNVRINKAKNMLLLSNESIKEISGVVGYTEANYFYSQFKKITGKSPSEFRKG